jgi:hypothetical protein
MRMWPPPEERITEGQPPHADPGRATPRSPTGLRARTLVEVSYRDDIAALEAEAVELRARLAEVEGRIDLAAVAQAERRRTMRKRGPPVWLSGLVLIAGLILAAFLAVVVGLSKMVG